MNWDLFLKYLGYGVVIAIYGVFAWFGKAPVEGFIAVLTGVISILGGSHAASSALKAATAAASVRAATAPQPAPQPPLPPPAPTIIVKD